MGRLKGVMWGLLLLGALPAWANPDRDGPQKVAPYERDMRMDRHDRRGDRQEKIERVRKEMAMRRLLRLTDELGLNESQALKLRDVLQAGDARKQVHQGRLREEVNGLKSLSEGAPTAEQVAAQLKRIADLRAALLAEDEQVVNDAAAGLPPAKKARLALVLGRHEQAMRNMTLGQRMKRHQEHAPQDGLDDEAGF